MKKNILKSLFVSVLCMLAASCQDTEFAETLDSSKAQVMFSIAMDTPAARSRATWDDNQGSQSAAIGDEYDNRIDMNQFIVKLEGKVNNVNKEYSIKEIIKWKEDGASENNYMFVGIVDGINGETTVTNTKITVYANMGETYSADIETKTFTRESAKEYIPMWGVASPGSLTFRPGKRENVGTISLLRAMAKFEVSISDALEAKGYKLTDVKLNKFNRKGNFMPKGYADVSETTILGQEAVLNENTTDQEQNVSLPALEENKKYVVYLPEISNTNGNELKMLLTFKKGTDELIETEVVVKDYTEANTGLINIVRNHWYQYEIKDIVNGQPEVHYNVLQWVTKDIEVGGAGFLGLSTDLVEVFSANTGTLQFVSSSPIVDVRLSDIYKHEKNGTFTEGTADGVKAYYITKFGKKTELGQYPGFTIANQETELARETQILNYIDNNVEWSENVNEGTITIDSPYMTHDEFKAESHNDTPRYLEFLVTNQQGMTATFRMVQYPPVVITNVEGYFSYREDFRIGNLPHYYYKDQFRSTFGQKEPIDNGEATHYKNPIAPFFSLVGFFKYNEAEWNNKTDRAIKNLSKVIWEEGVYGLMERDYYRTDAYKNNGTSGVFHRRHVLWESGSAYPDDNSANYDDESYYYQAVGPIYYKEDTKKYYRRHYTGSIKATFFAKFVSKVHDDGKATINKQVPNTANTIWDSWVSWGDFFGYHANHRMYHIRTAITSNNYTIGWPKMVEEDGRIYTAEGKANSQIVSPSFMVASQLGETTVQVDEQYYPKVPRAEGMYAFAKRQCEQYAEAFYEDIDNDGYTAGKDPITHYSDWRLPTKAELEVINNYQKSSRAMDVVLTEDSYFCASLDAENYNNSTVLFDRRTNPNGEITKYYMRCVRDVKPGEKPLKKVYPI